MKTFYCLILVFIFQFTEHLFAQDYHLDWAQTLFTDHKYFHNYASHMAIDGEGNILIAGTFFGTIEVETVNGMAAIESVYSADIFLMSYNEFGEILWLRSISGFSNKTILDFQLDSYGNILISGFFRGLIDFDTDPNAFHAKVSNGYYDGYVAKYSGNGELMWVNTFGDESIDAVLNVDTDANSDVYYTAFFNDEINVGFGGDSILINTDTLGTAFVHRLNSDGHHQDIYHFGYPNVITQISKFICAQDNSNFAVLTFKDSIDIDVSQSENIIYSTSTTWPYWDHAFVKYSNDFDQVWAFSIDVYNIIDVKEDMFGNIFVVGDFLNSVDFDPGVDEHILHPASNSDAYILKINSEGEFIWAKNISGSYGIESIDTDNEGNLYLFGDFAANLIYDPYGSSNQLFGADTKNGYIIKVDSLGNFVYGRTISGGDIHFSSACAVDEPHAWVVAGSFKGEFDADPRESEWLLKTKPTNINTFILKLNYKFADPIGMGDLHQELVQIYPNPTSDVFYIDNPSGQQLLIEVRDKLGRLISQKNSRETQLTIDLFNQSRGMYFVRVSDGVRQEAIKVIKQ